MATTIDTPQGTQWDDFAQDLDSNALASLVGSPVNTAASAYHLELPFQFAECGQIMISVSTDEYARMLEISANPRDSIEALRAMYTTDGD